MFGIRKGRANLQIREFCSQDVRRYQKTRRSLAARNLKHTIVIRGLEYLRGLGYGPPNELIAVHLQMEPDHFSTNDVARYGRDGMPPKSHQPK
mmetsp:Transcript_15992/g.32128  ORF Transcript_15992/g.32128 Transcript_15992/m.32128 type:complete len:93 (+) Transcript_15992:1298-1576(+)